jgi:PadR family transcriptional regulator, regulatory protein PadR
LLDIEAAILDAGITLKAQGSADFHGFSVAKMIQETHNKQRLASHGTLYKALGRLERAGLLTSEWEDADRAVGEGRPRRRLYRVTDLGETSLALACADEPLPETIIARLATP